MVLRLVVEGKRVGVIVFSYKVIGNLLMVIVEVVDEFVCIFQCVDEHDCCIVLGVGYVVNDEIEVVVVVGLVDIVVGMVWLFFWLGFVEVVDVFVVDEVGQLLLVNVFVVFYVVKVFVLFGDLQQFV